jgi:hypothetical protein
MAMSVAAVESGEARKRVIAAAVAVMILSK